MKLGIVTIQKNRAQWLAEWIAFHHLVGFERFYVYLHDCTDGSEALVSRLSQRFHIQSFVVPTDTQRPQLVAYAHACDSFAHEVDWLAFIDGDEFLFPQQGLDLRDVLSSWQYRKISAIGAYWKCFGSSGHIEEPEGLITENYRLSTPDNFEGNQHIKSIVRGRQAISVGQNAHLFSTPWGTVDERMRPIDKGRMTEYEPSYEAFQINHYYCQSLSYFMKTKKYSGAADAGSGVIRLDETFTNTNDASTIFDTSLEKYGRNLRSLTASLKA